MSGNKYIVKLTVAEKQHLNEFLRKGKSAARHQL